MPNAFYVFKPKKLFLGHVTTDKMVTCIKSTTSGLLLLFVIVTGRQSSWKLKREQSEKHLTGNSRTFWNSFLPCVQCHLGEQPSPINLLFGFKYVPACCFVSIGNVETTTSAPTTTTTQDPTKLYNTTGMPMK